MGPSIKDSCNFCPISTHPPCPLKCPINQPLGRASVIFGKIMASENVNWFHIYVVWYFLKTLIYHILDNFTIFIFNIIIKTKHSKKLFFEKFGQNCGPTPRHRMFFANHYPPQARTSFMDALFATFVTILAANNLYSMKIFTILLDISWLLQWH